MTNTGEWSWNGVSNVTVIAEDVSAADAAQMRLFQSGILLGMAGAGVFTVVLEFFGALQAGKRREQHAPEAPSAGGSARAAGDVADPDQDLVNARESGSAEGQDPWSGAVRLVARAGRSFL